jgi:poly(A) polymerase
MWDAARPLIRFDQAPDFDTAREPHVGDYVIVDPRNPNFVNKGHSNSIWHHKWLWVKDNYVGFDVDKSKEWSKMWLSKLGEPAKGTDVTWNSQLQKVGLAERTLMTEGTRDEAALEFLKQMVRKSPYAGKVFLAGGAVRDMVLGKVPKDLDVAVVGALDDGLKFAVWLAQQMGNLKGPSTPPPTDPTRAIAYWEEFSNPVLYPKFGTAKVNLTGTFNGVQLDGMEVEAVACRKETYVPGSRKPIVTAGTLQDDVFRRDFTTNSLMLDLTTDQTLDLTGKGIEDIKAGIIRTTSDAAYIFSEDPLRMMRAVRFMVQKGWKISPETEESIRKNAHMLKIISRERVRDELNKILVTPNPDAAFRKMHELGLLPYIAQEFQTMVGMTQNKHHKDDVFDHTLEVLKRTSPDLVRRLMGLFHDIGKIATRSETPTGVHFYGHEDVGVDIADKVLRDLKYPNEIVDAVKAGVKNHMRLKSGGDDAVKLSDKALRKFKVELGQNLEHILDLMHADNISHAEASSMPNQIANIRKRLDVLDVQVQKPNLPLNGSELLQLGVPKGPMVGKALSAITDAWFGNPNLSKDDAIAIARQFAVAA